MTDQSSRLARDKYFTEAKLKRCFERIDQSIARYLSQIEKEEIVLNAINNAEMMKSKDQISLSDSDARSMQDTGIVGYNVQIAIDTQHYVIVAHEVANVGSDRHQLINMAEQAHAEMAVETLNVVADRGYYEGEKLRACEEASVTVTLPKP